MVLWLPDYPLQNSASAISLDRDRRRMRELQEVPAEDMVRHVCNFPARLNMPAENYIVRQTLSMAMTLFSDAESAAQKSPQRLKPPANSRHWGKFCVRQSQRAAIGFPECLSRRMAHQEPRLISQLPTTAHNCRPLTARQDEIKSRFLQSYCKNCYPTLHSRARCIVLQMFSYFYFINIYQ